MSWYDENIGIYDVDFLFDDKEEEKYIVKLRDREENTLTINREFSTIKSAKEFLNKNREHFLKRNFKYATIEPK